MKPMSINNGDEENGDTNISSSSSSQNPLPTYRMKRLLFVSCLSIGVSYMILGKSNIELQTMKDRVVESAYSYLKYDKTYKREEDYEPLIGSMGEIFEESPWDSNHKDGSTTTNNNKYYDTEYIREDGSGSYDEISLWERMGEIFESNDDDNIEDLNVESTKSTTTSEDKNHPRVTCFKDARSTCESILEQDVDIDSNAQYAIPKKMASSGKKYSAGSTSEDANDGNLHKEETEECKLIDPSYQLKEAAPSTCNDIHALPFRFSPNKKYPTHYTSNHDTKYLTSGGFRAVWTVNLYSDEMQDRAIIKTNRISRGWSPYYLDQNRRDVLISEGAGSLFSRQPLHSNVLSIYQYCAFSSVVPFSSAGPLDDYMNQRHHDDNLLSAEEQYLLAIQAARGLYQAQLYRNGKATHVHADIKPPQFLLFDIPYQYKNTTIKNPPPVMQLNDFNRGKFLTQKKNNDTCPFTMCNVHHKGSTYRAPEEYMDCAPQADTIDVFSLGGVFYYLLADGEKPWYHLRSYKEITGNILKGEKPRLPSLEEYSDYDEDIISHVTKRSKHPAYLALKEIMLKCWAFKPEDRPSSFEVVQMLEKKYDDIFR